MWLRIASIIIIFISFITSVQSQFTLPGLIRDSMVLQRDTKLKMWGWASKGEVVKIKFNGKPAQTTAGQEGRYINYDMYGCQKPAKADDYILLYVDFRVTVNCGSATCYCTRQCYQ